MPRIFDISLFLFRPLGYLYGAITAIRHNLYAQGKIASFKANVPVISVGNLTMGGSGKTPVVMYLAAMLQGQGYKPAIISRGYKGKAKEDINVVSDGKHLLLTAEEAGDEPFMMASSLSGIPVLTGKKRALPCRAAIQTHGCDVILLDDGFQHLSLQRDIDLVLFNSATLNQHYHIFPSGILREPFGALQRSKAIIFTNFTPAKQEMADAFIANIKTYLDHNRIFYLGFSPAHLKNNSGELLPFEKISQLKCAAFCGIASPARFHSTLNGMHLDIKGFTTFPDHHEYSGTDLHNLEVAAEQAGARILLTTEKDLVKLSSFICKLPLYAVCMQPVVPESFDNFILDQLKQINS